MVHCVLLLAVDCREQEELKDEGEEEVKRCQRELVNVF